MSGHFVIGFLNRDVEKEYQKLDGSQRRLVRIAIEKLKTRADEIGTPLHILAAACRLQEDQMAKRGTPNDFSNSRGRNS